MRIAQVAPLHERVPPRLYGGTERVVYGLTEALVAQGHDVTLFASGDSMTSGRLVPVTPAALRLVKIRDGCAHPMILIEHVLAEARTFAVLEIAAKIDAAAEAYYRRQIAPLFDAPHVEFLTGLSRSVWS